MTDLQELWKDLERKKKWKELPSNLPFTLSGKSKHPVQKLKWAFALGLAYIAFCEGIFIYLLFAFPQPLVRVFLFLVVLGYVFFFVVNLKVYNFIKKETDFSLNLKQMLVSIHDKVSASLRFQRRAAIFIYPISASAGFLIGLATEANPTEVMQERAMIISMIITAVVLTPLAYWAARWMENVSYGRYLRQLNELIRNLDEQ